jgi:hypothetical protein
MLALGIGAVAGHSGLVSVLVLPLDGICPFQEFAA